MSQEKIDAIRSGEIGREASEMMGRANMLTEDRQFAQAREVLEQADMLLGLAARADDIAQRAREEYHAEGIPDPSSEAVIIGLTDDLGEEALTRVLRHMLTHPLASRVLATVAATYLIEQPQPAAGLLLPPQNIGSAGEQRSNDEGSEVDGDGKPTQRLDRRVTLVKTMLGLDSRSMIDSFEGIMLSTYSDKVNPQADPAAERERIARYYQSPAIQGVDEFLDQFELPELPKGIRATTKQLIAELKAHPRFIKLSKSDRRKVMLREEGWRQVWQPEPAGSNGGRGAEGSPQELQDLTRLQDRIIISALETINTADGMKLENASFKDLVCHVYERQVWRERRRKPKSDVEGMIERLGRELKDEVRVIMEKLKMAVKAHKEGKLVPEVLGRKIRKFQEGQEHEDFGLLSFDELEQVILRTGDDPNSIFTTLALKKVAASNRQSASFRIRVSSLSEDQATSIIDTIVGN